jgi:acyl-CoA synthetase (AMP-forming)/AMP-acid ligase II
VLCAHSEYLKAVDSVRDQMPGVRHFVAFEGTADGWLDYEAAIAAADPGFARPEIRERDLLSIETPHAFVVLAEGASTTDDDIIAFARDNLAHFKAPRGVTFVGELPKTATGKIQKFVLRRGAPNLARQ